MKKFVFVIIVSMLAAATAFGGATSNQKSEGTGSWEEFTLQEVSSDQKSASYFSSKVGSLKGEIRLLNLHTGESRPAGDQAKSSFSPDGSWFVRATGMSGAVLTNMSTGKEFVYPCGGEFKFSPGSRYLTIVPKHQYGNDTCVGDIQRVELSTLSVSTIPKVIESSFSPDRKKLAYVTQRGSEYVVSILNVESPTEARSLFSSKSNIKTLAWDEDGSALAFLESFQVDEGTESFVVHLYDGETLRSFDHRRVQVFPSDSLVGSSNLRVTKDRSAVLFELKPAQTAVQTVPVAKPLVQVWHSRDVRVVSDLFGDRKPTRSAAWNFDLERFTDLSVGGRQVVTLSGQGSHALTYVDNHPGRIQHGYVDESDVMLESTDLRTGETRVIHPKLRIEYLMDLTLSPSGRFLAYFRDNHWWVYDFETGGHVNASAAMKVDLRDAEQKNVYPPPYGSPGWTDDERLVVYDRYDIWLVSSSGMNPQKITMGRQERKIYRFHAEERQPLLTGARPSKLQSSKTFALDGFHVLTLFGERSKKSGFATYSSGRGVVELKYDDVHVRNIFLSPDHRSIIYQEERFDTPPQLVAQDIDSGVRKVLARSNPQFDKSAWGAATTIEYKDDRGRYLQGTLFSPAGYRKGVKYPMIVSIYELQSDGKHRFQYPEPSEYMSASSFTSNGYFVLLPDIRYGRDSPGTDALGAVTAAVSEVLKRGDVDAKAVGITGTSWGGYQTTFIITQSNMFSAAVAGAAPTDFVSWYLSNETGRGTPTMWRYERDQARIKTPLHENATAYLKNSPVLHAGKVNTPLLSWFGEKDSMISASQPIEMYNALRRAGKEHVLLMYPGEDHVLQSAAALDLHARVRQWFDHYLKGAPAAEWMERGEDNKVKDH